MTELTKEELQDYGNEFNALISASRLEMPLDEYRLQMPHEYFQTKYPDRYQEVSYPDSFEYRRLEIIVEYFNKQLHKTKQLLKRLLRVVGQIIYGNTNQFVCALP